MIPVGYKHGYPCDTVIAARTDSKRRKNVAVLALRFSCVLEHLLTVHDMYKTRKCLAHSVETCRDP